MTTTQNEFSKVKAATTQTVLAIDPSLPRAEQVARIKAIFEMLKNIGEE